MNSEIDQLELCGLVAEAKCGDQASLTRLAELVEDNLRSYIYRLTLDPDLTADLLQETLLQMVKSIGDLKRTDRFWPWLLRTSLGKVQYHYSVQKRKRKINMWAIAKERLLSCSQQNDALSDKIIRQELSDAIFKAMGKLSLSYRNVLVLRCFEQASFAEIGEMLDCSELKARVTFFRAKLSLKRRLARRGFGKKALFIMAVSLFGLLTAPAKASVATTTVTAASFEVGPLAVLIGFLGTKLGIVTAAAIGALTAALAVKAFLWFVALLLFLLIFIFIAAFAR